MDNPLLIENQDNIRLIIFNRIDKHNAFDDDFLLQLQHAIEAAQQDAQVRIIVLKANGRHFSAGADLTWMQRMAQYTEAENIADANLLATVMATLYHCSKPTIAMVQGAAFGGGAGLVAACDIAIATDSARFCFSEVKLGLIPAVISPYVIKAIGERAATWLFTSAEVFDAARALTLQLIHHVVPEGELHDFTLHYASQMAQGAPQAMSEAKQLVRQVSGKPLDNALQQLTANLIAKKRSSAEGQRGILAFLNKEVPKWD